MEILVDGLDHPECVAWGRDGFAYAGGEAGQLYRLNVADGTVTLAGDNGGWILGIALDGNDRIYACNPTHNSVERFSPDGAVATYSKGTAERPMFAPNYPVFAPDGTLYVSDSGDWQSGNGCIYKIDPEGGTSVWTEAARQFPNGLALDSTGEFLYVVESTMPGIVKFPIEAGGRAGEPELVLAMPGCVPDGLAFDRDGGLYIGCYRPDRVYYFSPLGELLIVADDYQGTTIAAPTNIAFYGDELDRLLIASLARWHVGSLRPEVPGQPLNYPVLS